jgi:uncharacterized protein (TIGR02246 family)
MTRRLILIAICLAFPFSAFAGSKEDAQAVFDKFLTAFTAANLDEVVGLFAPDALVWGTTMRDLATTPDALRQYFSVLSARKPNEMKASALGPYSALVLSDNAVLVSGMWQVERMVDDKPTVTVSRISIAVVKRGDRWLIAQFHNSRRPEPAPATPPTR